jgi:hypothetical protein
MREVTGQGQGAGLTLWTFAAGDGGGGPELESPTLRDATVVLALKNAVGWRPVTETARR